jgi:tetratricopeptide (TPR) repeat protein
MAKPQSSRSPAHLGEAIHDAIVFHQAGQFAEAEKRYARVLKTYPGQFDALHLLGVVKYQRGRLGEAYQLITSALKVNPQSPDALANLAMVLHALKRDEEALASVDKALALAPDHLEALNNRGNALLALKRPRDAIASFERVLVLAPRHVEARVNLGNALAMLSRHEEAIAAYDAAIAAHPGYAGAHFNRGHALFVAGRPAEAVTAFDQTLALAPHHIGALINRGLACQELNRFEDAIQNYRAVIALEPSHADAHFNEALALLTRGNLRAGFEKFEWRWKRTGMEGQRRSLGKPLWLGEYPLARKTILLHAEQGLGDTIHFVRYAPLVARMGANVILEVQPALKELLGQVEGVTQVVARGDPLPAFDVHCPLASLPLALHTEAATVPADIPYLAASEDWLAKWRDLENLPAPRIALAWSGRPTHANDRNRSIPLARLAPLLANAEARFVSVQRDLREADAAVLRNLPVRHVGDHLDSFTDTAAVLALCDLVISVDTSVAHLSAAMGRLTWILLPFSPDWRWTLRDERSPWYPSARLFRQPAPGDWDSVIASVQSELDRKIAEKKS